MMRPEEQPVSWDAFAATHGPYSVAIDGYLNAGPQIDVKKKLANFDHHSHVARFATLSTCAQVLNEIRQGFYRTFCDDRGNPHVDIYANDCDQDVSTAVFLFNHPELIENATVPALNRLVDVESKLDVSLGTYPFSTRSKILRKLAWVFQPYTAFRSGGGLESRSAAAFAGVVTDVEHRIMKHIMGEGSELELDFRYNRTGSGKGWTQVEEVGAQSRLQMRKDGIEAFLSSRTRQNGRWDHVIGRMSEYVPMPMERILASLNAVEPQAPWGGGTTVLGSNRRDGSGKNPDEVGAIMNTDIAWMLKNGH